MAPNPSNHRTAKIIVVGLLAIALAPIYFWPLLPLLVIALPLLIILVPALASAWHDDRDDHHPRPVP